MAHKRAKWVRQPCRLRDPHGLRTGAKSEVAQLEARWLRHPCRLGDPHRCRAGGKIRSGPQVGKVATSAPPSRGSPVLQSEGQNQKWHSCGQSGYVTPAVSGIPTASEQGGKSKVAHKWAKWLRHPCCLGNPHRFRAEGKIRSGRSVGKVATSPLPSRGSPLLQRGGGETAVAHLRAKWLRHPCRLGDPHRFRSGGQNQKWPISGQSGYITSAVSGIPTACEGGGKISSGSLLGKVATSPLPSRRSPPLRSAGGGGIRSGRQKGKVGTSPLPSRGSPLLENGGGKSEVAHLWARRLRHPCRLMDPHHFRAEGKIRSGPIIGQVATSPMPSPGSQPLESAGGNQKWPRSGQSGYVTPAVSGILIAGERGGKSEVAHKWAKWLRHPCRLGDRHCFRAEGKINSGTVVGKVATSPLPSQGSPPLQSGGQSQKWPTRGQSGYVTPAVSGIPTALERGGGGGGIGSAPQRCKVATSPPPSRGSRPRQSRGKIRSGPLIGKVPTSPPPSREFPPLESGGGNQKWPISGQSGYVTLAASGIPTASERGGGGIRSGPQKGKVATSPLPSRGSPPL